MVARSFEDGNDNDDDNDTDGDTNDDTHLSYNEKGHRSGETTRNTFISFHLWVIVMNQPA